MERRFDKLLKAFQVVTREDIVRDAPRVRLVKPEGERAGWKRWLDETDDWFL